VVDLAGEGEAVARVISPGGVDCPEVSLSGETRSVPKEITAKIKTNFQCNFLPITTRFQVKVGGQRLDVLLSDYHLFAKAAR
jgi:hypothetical protein